MSVAALVQLSWEENTTTPVAATERVGRGNDCEATYRDGAERRYLINTVLIHATGWVKVPVQFLALAVVAGGAHARGGLLFHAALRLFEIARVLVRLDHVARFIVNTNHGIR
jgi:hypothetical protein